MEVKHISEIAKTDYWMFRLKGHDNETKGFTLDIDALTDDELTGMLGVTPEFLRFAPYMFRVISEKHHPDMRRAISYLNHLNALQSAAWKRTIQKWKEDGDLLKKVIEEKDPETRKNLTLIYCDGKR